MINEKSLAEVSKANFSKNFCKPLYSSYCFSKIPSTVKALFSGDFSNALASDAILTNKNVDHVILFLLDGFGWTFFEKYKTSLPFLQRLESDAIVSKVTSMFPSTTAAHITCLNTDQTPAQSGIYEWFIYEPKLREIIAPLLYSFAGDHKSNALLDTALSEKELFPQETLYHELSELGVRSYVFQPSSICDSPYSRAILDGARVHGFSDLRSGVEKLFCNLPQKSYSYFYYSDIDAIGHRKGIFTEEFSHAIEKIFNEIERNDAKIPPNTAVIITADHGMVPVDPKRTFYLNKKIPNIEKYLQVGGRGKPLVPAGSCRDLFLHVHEEKLKECKEVLEIFLKGIAEVYETRELIEDHFFGPKTPSQNFLSRVGNLVILPYKGEAVWWFEKNRFQQNFYAAHGGLTREEMETIFLFYMR